jgi:putative ABC transport system substrate-binding protein
MRRRELITFLGGAVAIWPFTVSAQLSGSRPLITWLAGATEWNASKYIGFLKEGLQELDYAEGRNFDFTARFADGCVGRLPGLAEELVRLKPAVIVAGAVDAAVACRNVTTTIPIVSAALADAVHLGLIGSYAHPGSNVTGITPYVEGLPAKQLELAREVVPGASKVGLLGNMNDPKAPPQSHGLEDAARTLGVKIIVPEIHTPGDLTGAIQALASERVDAVIVLQTTMLLSERRQIGTLLATNRLPAVYGYREHVDDGGLISYGVDLHWCWHHLATYVQKILSGTAPGDLPVELPTKLQLVVNLKTARALGLTISPLVLARIDEVID